MKITIKSKNLELTPLINEFVEKKLESIKKFISILKQDVPEGEKTLAEVIMELEKETNHHRKGEIFLAKAMVNLPGRSLTAEFRSDDLYKAIIGAKDELKMEIEKYKVRKTDKNRREQRKFKREVAI